MDYTTWVPLVVVGVLLLVALLIPRGLPDPNHEFMVGMLEHLSEELDRDGNRAEVVPPPSQPRAG